MKTRIFSIIVGIILLSQLAYAGVTNPLPSEMQLLEGESGRFKFQIQAITSEQDLICEPSLAEETSLDIDFDQKIITVSAGSIKEAYGTVTAPDKIGTYTESFCISCEPVSDIAGTSVQMDTCDLPITVDVVGEKTKENMTVEPEKPLPSVLILLMVAGIIAAAYIIFYIVKKKINRPSKQSGKKAKKVTKRSVRKSK